MRIEHRGTRSCSSRKGSPMTMCKLPLFLVATLAISASAIGAGNAYEAPHQPMGTSAKSMKMDMSSEMTFGSPDRQNAVSRDTSKAPQAVSRGDPSASPTGWYSRERDGWWKDD